MADIQDVAASDTLVPSTSASGRLVGDTRATASSPHQSTSPANSSNPTGDTVASTEDREPYRRLFRLVPVALYSCDAEGVIQEYNQRAVELWGREPHAGDPNERYCGSFKTFHPDGRPMPRNTCPMARALRGETLTEDELEILVERPDGSLKHVLAHPEALKNENGEIVGAINCLYDITARRHAEDEAALLAAIVTSTSDAIASKTLDGIITSWNASAERMFGYTAREIIGQSVLLIIPPERRHEEVRILARLRAGERIEHYETVRVTKDGRELDVSLTISPVRNTAGVIIGASKIVQDITARKRTERLLAEQRHLLEIIASGGPMEQCLIEVTSAVTRLEPSVRACVVLADAAHEKILDVYAAEIASSFAGGLRHAPINELAIGMCGAAIYSAEPVACEDIGRDERWSKEWRDLCVAHGILACHFEPIVGSNGLPLGSLMLCFDAPRAPTAWELRIAQFGTHLASIVIERARADNALRESEEKFRALADNVPHLAWMAHPDGNIFWYNRRWYDYTGMSPESQAGWGWQSVHDPDALPAVTERWRHSLATGESFEMVFPLRGADGVFRPFLTRIVSIRDEQGRVVRWFGANTDITAQRETEEALRASELALQEANQQKDEFLGIASHELRTPLTSITGNVQLAERMLARLSPDTPTDRPESGDQLTASALARLRLLMERTDRQVARLDRLVGDLLDVSRISAGKLDMRLEPCDLLEIVRETVEGQRAAWPDRTVTLTLPRRGALPLVADADRIGQVVINYVTNALKYSESDRPVAVRVSAAKGQARVEVRDQGPGLTSEQQTRLFERFYRVPGIEQRNGSGIGLGLGLHICKTIIERHGGQVGVESVPGKGSVFWFTAPLAESLPDAKVFTE
ncbi:MAG TPA: PAS domain S-box protein [Ktedonobacterales bacterium]|nr:PAS domain S-box protein [Ktedonobacterales bacterium]